jgi:5-methylcytosine-specific restriction endonuclease McrA
VVRGVCGKEEKNVSTYSELLRDPRWQRKRLEILSQSNFTCEECGAGEKTLNVHHIKYRKGAKPWEYSDFELKSLCEECHHWWHEFKAVLEPLLGDLSKDDRRKVMQFAIDLAQQAGK